LTSSTTLAVLLCLFILGGGVIEDFALALLVGVIVGTYSSVFVASPILLLLPEGRPAFSMAKAPAPARKPQPAPTPAPEPKRTPPPAKAAASKKRSRKKKNKRKKK
jgi:preprotein translocase subunit SecF